MNCFVKDGWIIRLSDEIKFQTALFGNEWGLFLKNLNSSEVFSFSFGYLLSLLC